MLPRWLTWIFIAVLGYMIYAAGESARAPVTPVSSVDTAAPEIEDTSAIAELTDTEHWKRTLNPDYAATMNCSLDRAKTKGTLTLKVIEDETGNGDAAQCGETITIQLTVWNAKGSKRFDGELPLALGTRALASGLDVGLLGVKPGGVRTLVLPPIALARSKTSTAPETARKALSADTTTLVTVKRLR